MVDFQYISDIHLEISGKIPDIPKSSNNLCLLGDIGAPESDIYKKFIKECSEKFTNVFVIYGNHEYYSETSMKKIEDISLHFPSKKDLKLKMTYGNVMVNTS